MALVASPVRATPGGAPLTEHDHELSPGEEYEHPQPGEPALIATPMQSARTQPGAEHEHEFGPGNAKGPGVKLGTGAIPAPRHFRAAGFFRRAAAALVDFALLIPVCATLGLGLCLLFDQPIPRLAELSPDLLIAALLDGNAASEALLVLSAIVFFLYFFVFHAARGQTPGKRFLGLRVIDAYGSRPGLFRTLLRTAAYLLSFLPFSLGFLWIGFDRERRALHDWVAGTYVVRVP